MKNLRKVLKVSIKSHEGKRIIELKGVLFLHRLNINAIVLYPLIIFAEKEVPPILDNHERIHIDQIRRDGVVGFYFRYLVDYIKLRRSGLCHDLAYRNIPYEKEAYENESNLNYQVVKPQVLA